MITKEELLARRGVIKTKMDFLKLYMKGDLAILHSVQRSIKKHKEEYKKLEREYLELLEQYE